MGSNFHLQRRRRRVCIKSSSSTKDKRKVELKIGKLEYAYGRYEKIHRATIPINEDNFLLVTWDIEQKNFDSIIMDKIGPSIRANKSRFIRMMSDSI